MKRHCLSLEPLTFSALEAGELVMVAAEAGFEFVSFTLSKPVPDGVLEASKVVTDLDARQELKALMRETGVRMLNIECFNLVPEAQVDSFRPALECAHDLGGRSGTAIFFENPDRNDALRKYRSLCDMAEDYGISINVEFFSMCRTVTNFEQALDFVQEANRPNGGLVIDFLHLIRNGSSVERLKEIDPALIKMVQFCDAPAVIPPDLSAEEAIGNRMYPGEGSLPCREFLAALPDDAVVGLEIPKARLGGKVSPLQQAKDMIAATLRIYEML